MRHSCCLHCSVLPATAQEVGIGIHAEDEEESKSQGTIPARTKRLNATKKRSGNVLFMRSLAQKVTGPKQTIKKKATGIRGRQQKVAAQKTHCLHQQVTMIQAEHKPVLFTAGIFLFAALLSLDSLRLCAWYTKLQLIQYSMVPTSGREYLSTGTKALADVKRPVVHSAPGVAAPAAAGHT